MNVLFGLALVVGGLMGVLVWTAWRRWPQLDPGQRWVGRGIGVFFGLFLVAYPMALAGQRTRLVQELPILAGTLCYLVAFSKWQSLPAARVLIRGGMILFVAMWIGAQFVQGLADNFSTVSGPIHGTMIMAAGSVTLIAHARAGTDRWTTRAWFWVSTGFMLIYGTEVLLDPLLHRIFQVRDDLGNLAFAFHQISSAIGYLLVFHGFTPAGGSGIRGRPRLG